MMLQDRDQRGDDLIEDREETSRVTESSPLSANIGDGSSITSLGLLN